MREVSMKGLIGKKVGMTQIFDEDGRVTPVTVIEAGPCVVVQQKTEDNDGYSAVQLGFDDQKESRLTKAEAGHFAKAGVSAKKEIREFRIRATEESPEMGAELTASVFDGVSFVDITAHSKGRGFQGVVKRYGFAGGRASHGGGWLRRPGSIGMCTSPARVMKNKKMPGHMGSSRVTTQNLRVVQVRPEENLIFVRGSVPGPNGGIVVVREALKKQGA
jgi:large subunit ribosomal protein L3